LRARESVGDVGDAEEHLTAENRDDPVRKRLGRDRLSLHKSPRDLALYRKPRQMIHQHARGQLRGVAQRLGHRFERLQRHSVGDVEAAARRPLQRAEVRTAAERVTQVRGKRANVSPLAA
jgi:hypothetical protein